MIIFNPLAGPADVHLALGKVADFWRGRGWVVVLQATQFRGHARQLAAEAAADGYMLVLAGGGDGTLAEAANGLAHSETILAPLPIGTGNVFAKELHMPRPNMVDHRPLVEASAKLASGRVHQMDIGQFADGYYWLLWAGTGVDGYLVDRLEPRPKAIKRLGSVGYALQSAFIIPQFPGLQASVQVDDQQVDGEFVLITITNVRLFAGGVLELNPGAALDDGKFEVWLVHGKGLPALSRLMLATTIGLGADHSDITVLPGRRVVVQAKEEMPVHADGDPHGTTPFHCNLIPGALRMLIPQSAPAGLFTQPGVALAQLVAGQQSQ
jgi:YegS/Rv2252/BmrU family lipid kinase